MSICLAKMDWYILTLKLKICSKCNLSSSRAFYWRLPHRRRNIIKRKKTRLLPWYFDLTNVFIDSFSIIFFLRFVSLWNVHPLNHVSCFLFSNQFSLQYFRFNFKMWNGTFLISIHFQQLIREKTNKKSFDLPGKKLIFFSFFTSLWNVHSNFQSATKKRKKNKF